MMKLHEIYGLPATATEAEINDAAKRHAVECAQGLHGSVVPTLGEPPVGMRWDQASSQWEECPKE